MRFAYGASDGCGRSERPLSARVPYSMIGMIRLDCLVLKMLYSGAITATF